MRRFIYSFLSFIFLLFFIVLIINTISSKIINQNANFKIKAHNLVLGHSHPQAALNDSLIQDVYNATSGGEAYVYTYQKTKQFIIQNPQINTVFIEFTNNQISSIMNTWIWNQEYMIEKYTIYAPFFSNKEKWLLAKPNIDVFFKVSTLAMRKKLDIIVKGDYNYIDKIGKYYFNIKNKIDSCLNTSTNFLPDSIKIKFNTLSKVNILYLHKIVDLCNQYNKRIVLIRCPQHKKYPGLSNETLFQQILNTQFKGIPFLDFNCFFSLNNENFADLEHLNYLGAQHFSTYFNDLINHQKILENACPQVAINHYLDSLNQLQLSQSSSNSKTTQ